jgi:hypothetical protein
MSVKKIIQRRGNMADLPILSSGEIGYATDSRRMFIGNDIITLTGSVDPEFVYDFNIPLQSMASNLYSIFINDYQQQNAVDYVVLSTGGIKFTVSHPPLTTSDSVHLQYNTEIPIKESITTNESISVELDGNASVSTPIPLTATLVDARNNFNFHYTISNASSFRKGILSVSTSGTNVILDDSFATNATNKLNHIFSGAVTNSTFVLSYITSDTESVNFSYMIDEEYHHQT